MYKLIILSAFLAITLAAPAPSDVVYSSPVLTPVVTHVVPHVVSSVVSPAVISYSSFSNSVVHGTPVVAMPVVRQALLHQPPIVHTHTLPVAYTNDVYVV